MIAKLASGPVSGARDEGNRMMASQSSKRAVLTALVPHRVAHAPNARQLFGAANHFAQPIIFANRSFR
jgi:hypothetical protein